MWLLNEKDVNKIIIGLINMKNIDSKPVELSPEIKQAQQVALNLRNKQRKREKEVKIGDTTYVIKRWSNSECLARMPEFAHLIYVPMVGTIYEEQESLEGATTADMINLMFTRLRNDAHFFTFIESCLNKTFVKGSEAPVDIDEDFESPDEVVKLVGEVLEANFMIRLCSSTSELGPQAANLREIVDQMQQTQQG